MQDANGRRLAKAPKSGKYKCVPEEAVLDYCDFPVRRYRPCGAEVPSVTETSESGVVYSYWNRPAETYINDENHKSISFPGGPSTYTRIPDDPAVPLGEGDEKLSLIGNFALAFSKDADLGGETFPGGPSFVYFQGYYVIAADKDFFSLGAIEESGTATSLCDVLA